MRDLDRDRAGHPDPAPRAPAARGGGRTPSRRRRERVTGKFAADVRWIGPAGRHRRRSPDCAAARSRRHRHGPAGGCRSPRAGGCRRRRGRPAGPPTRRSTTGSATRAARRTARARPGRSRHRRETGRTHLDHQRGERQLPASNVKLLTAVNALASFGPALPLPHTVLEGSTDGPSSSSAPVTRRCPGPTCAAGHPDRRGRTGRAASRVQVESTTPCSRRRAGPRLEVDLHARDVFPVRALVVDQHRRWDTTIDAGQVFAQVLERKGLDVRRSVSRVTATAGAPPLAEVHGDDLATTVAAMLRPATTTSPRRCTGWSRCRPATRRPGRAPPRHRSQRSPRSGSASALPVYDGSGLSRADRLRPRAGLCAALPFDPAHPTSSPCGTARWPSPAQWHAGPRLPALHDRPTRCAAGLIEAKTGSLSGVIALSGYARGADGRTKAFSFLSTACVHAADPPSGRQAGHDSHWLLVRGHTA